MNDIELPPQQPHNSTACTCLFCWSENRQLRFEIYAAYKAREAAYAAWAAEIERINKGVPAMTRDEAIEATNAKWGAAYDAAVNTYDAAHAIAVNAFNAAHATAEATYRIELARINEEYPQ